MSKRRDFGELGADATKTFYTGERFPEIVAAVPAPILVLGASKAAEETDALEMAHHAMRSGARGLVFGRNLFQAADPAACLKALGRIVHEGVGPDRATGQSATARYRP